MNKSITYRLEKNKVFIKSNDRELLIEFINDKIFRVYEELERKTNSFAIENLETKDVELSIEINIDSLIIKSKILSIKVYDNLMLDIYHFDKLLCEDYKGKRNPFKRHAISTYETDEEKEKAKALSLAEGHESNDDDVNHHKIEVLKVNNQNNIYYALGEKTGFLNKQGYEYEMWNTDEPSAHLEYFKTLYKSVPFYISFNNVASYGIFFDNTYKTYFDMGKENSEYIYFGSDNGNLDYYFIYGPSLKDVVSNYISLTGKTPLPKRKMLGIHQSRWSYGTKERVDEIINGYIDNDLPLDVIHLDIDYMDNYKVFTYDKSRFDLKNNIEEWKNKGIEVVTIIDPGTKVEKGYFMYEDGIKNNYFATRNNEVYVNSVWPGKSVFPDFSKEITRNWWGKSQKIMTDFGVSGIWNDMNEPASFEGPLPDDVEFDKDGQKANHLEIHNVYGHLMAKATFEGLKEATNERPYVLTRAAYAGSQKYTSFWTGDNQSLWIHLQMAIPMLCNMSLSGFSFIGTDIGGFGGDVTKELLIRWAQVGVFFPLCRNHSAMMTRDQEPFSFDKETISIYRKALKIRESLIPYYYDLFYHGEQNNTPVMLPLVYYYQDDENTYNLNDQFMIGDSIMVAPVLEQGKTKRMVYLPKGTWYNINNHKTYTGNQYIVEDAPLDTCPIYVKDSSIIPTYDNINHINEQNNIVFNIFPGNSSYEHIYDDGKSYDYRNNILTSYNIKTTQINDNLLIDVDVTNNYKTYENVIYRIYNTKGNIFVDDKLIDTNNKSNYLEIKLDGLSHKLEIK